MINNYFKIVWRNLVRDRQFTFLNLIGLSTGLACVLLIYLWVNDELHVDKFHKKDSQLFQVMQNHGSDGSIGTTDQIEAPVAKALMEEIPEIEDAAVSTAEPGYTGILSIENTHIKAMELSVSRNFFDVFSYNLTHGDKDQALSDKSGVVLSDELALKLFHTTENIIGKRVEWNRGDFNGSYIVSGVFENQPHSTSQYDLLFPHAFSLDIDSSDAEDWEDLNLYVILKKGTDVGQFNKNINGFIKSKNKRWINSFFLQRYSDKYLYNKYENGVQAGGRIEYVKLFSIIALFILVIACVNFMNLSTAKAARRLKEVGIKKVVGANRGTLILQYLGESMLMSFLSLIIAIVLVALFLPQFNVIAGKHLALNFDANIILSVLGITFFTGLIAGSYPAFYLSGLKPVTVLKGKIHTSLGEQWVRKGLVVFQFTLSVIFIISVLVVYKQMKLIQTIDLGYKKDNIISFKKDGKLYEHLPIFLSDVKKLPGVVNASSMDGDMTGNHGGVSGVDWDGKDPAYRIDIGAGVFVIAGVAILFITLLTISFQAIRAAFANPVKSLRTE